MMKPMEAYFHRSAAAKWRRRSIDGKLTWAKATAAAYAWRRGEGRARGRVCIRDSEQGIGACLRLVFGQFLLVLIAQSGRVLPLSLYPILPSKPTLIVCNTRLTTHRDTQDTYMRRKTWQPRRDTAGTRDDTENDQFSRDLDQIFKERAVSLQIRIMCFRGLHSCGFTTS